MLTRKTRFWLILSAIPIVLILLAVVALKVMFTGDRLKGMIVPRVEAATGREMTMNDVSLRVFPSIALELEGVTLSNIKGKGFSPTPFLSIDVIRLDVKLLPLLAKKVEVTTLTVSRPYLLLEVNEQNESNYSNFGVGSSGPGPSVSSGSAPGSGAESAAFLLISDIRIDNGVLEYLNHKENSATRLRAVRLDGTVDAPGNQVLIRGKLTVDSLSYGTIEKPLIDGIRVSLEHRMVYDLQADQLRFERGDLTVQRMPLRLDGTISGLRSTTVLDCSVGSDSVNIAELLSIIPKEYMSRAEGVKGNGVAQVRIAVTGTLTDSTSADVNGGITARGASLQYPRLPKPITNINIVCGFARTRTKQEFRVESLTATLGISPMEMTMSVVNFDDPYLTLKAAGSLDLATVHEYYPLERGTELSGQAKADIRLAGRINDPKTIQATGAMGFSNVTAKAAEGSKPVRNLSGVVAFNNQILESKNLSFSLGRSDLTLAFRMKDYLSLASTEVGPPRPTATIALQSKSLYTEDITGGEDVPSGEGGAGTAAPMSGTKTKTAAPVPGEQSGLPLPGVDMEVTASIGKLVTEKFEFADVRSSMRIAGGIITIRNFSCNAFGGSVASKGTLDLRNPQRPLFDMTMDLARLQANAILPNFTSFGQRLFGSLTLNTSLKGALDDTLGLVPAALNGSGSVGLTNGSLKGFKVNQALASSLNLPDLETINFKDWTNAFTIQGGRMVLSNLTIKAFNADYVVNGSQGLDGSLDYRLALYLPEGTASRLKVSGFAGEAVNLFKDQSGRLRFDFNIGGTTDDPKVQLDTGPAQKRAEDLAKQKIDDETKKLQQSLQDKASDALKKLFKQKPK